MKLYIAEKPSLGRAIADVLPKPHVKGDGFIRSANGDCVSWCIGHLLEQAEPEAYDPAFKRWKQEHLPIIPEQWQLKPKTKTRKQLSVLRKLVKEAQCIVHAGDPDREGQLLVDQVIDYLKVSASKKATVQRCLISDLNAPAVKRALEQLRPNKDFVPLSTSALARSRADWLYGINMTRAYTLQGQKVGYSGLLSVGRVQTPVLGIVARRDIEIEGFVSKPFFEVLAHLKPESQAESFVAKWQPSEACRPYMDENGKVVSRALAENVIGRIEGKSGLVSQVVKQPKAQAPPLPYSLSTLQIDAAKRFSMSAQQVLDTCQALYERHKLITYPRSDSRYLPSEHFNQAADVSHAIRANSQEMAPVVDGSDISIKGRAWNDSKVDAHHAIIPTAKKCDLGRLSSQERKLYEHISRQYLCQFYPKWEYTDTRIEALIEGGLFVAKARVIRSLGWKALFQREAPSKKSGSEDEDMIVGTLPKLKKGDVLRCIKTELLEKQTQPPKHFTDASLLAAMTGISRYVSDASIRKILKDTDGLGTEATRAGILELLFKRDFLVRKGKQIHATLTGRALIESLPESATTPDMTAHWESVLESVSTRNASYGTFMTPLMSTLRHLIEQSRLVLPKGLNNLPPSKAPQKRKTYKRKSKKKSKT